MNYLVATATGTRLGRDVCGIMPFFLQYKEDLGLLLVPFAAMAYLSSILDQEDLAVLSQQVVFRQMQNDLNVTMRPRRYHRYLIKSLCIGAQ